MPISCGGYFDEQQKKSGKLQNYSCHFDCVVRNCISLLVDRECQAYSSEAQLNSRQCYKLNFFVFIDIVDTLFAAFSLRPTTILIAICTKAALEKQWLMN